MQRDAATPALICLLGLLAFLLFPALILDHRVAPEASLKGTPPWRLQWGPQPAPSRGALEAATRLGPRLQGIARDGLSTALWNPWIGGGRPGWLSSPREGGAPLAVAAGLFARVGWTWTALVALQIAVAFGTAAWVLRRLGLGPWPACAGGIAYALSGAVASQALSWQGSALALGPLALVPATMQGAPWPRRAAAWGAVLVLLLASGPPALQFIAVGLVFETLSPGPPHRPRRLAALLIGLAAAATIVLPTVWLDRVGHEVAAGHAGRTQVPEVTLRALVEPPPMEEPAAGGRLGAGGAAWTSPGQGFLSLPVLLLAAIGAVAGRGHPRRVWIGVIVVAAGLTWASHETLETLGVLERPFGVAALAAAFLAGMGAEALAQRAPTAWRNPAVAFACAILVLRLAPPFAQRLPFAQPGEALLASPLPAHAVAAGGRFVAVISAVPPDLGATLGVADARAIDLRREPRYAARLGVRDTGELPLARVFDGSLPDLGVRWLVEPLPVRVVSGEIFARVDTSEARVDRHGPTVAVPPGATRLGVPAGRVTPALALRQGRVEWRLEGDATLAAESDAWTWFALPEAVTDGAAELHGLALPAAASGITVAWDRSGLREVEEVQGARVWEWPRATPMVHFEGSASGDPSPRAPVRVTVNRPASIAAAVSAPESGHLVFLVKYRPRLWHARVNGERVATAAAGEVWTAVPVAPGAHEVVLSASLPWALGSLSACGIVGLAALAVAGRRS